MEMHDTLIEALANGDEAALLVLDQSKAFDIISHKILIDKLKIVGFRNQATNLMKSFLKDHKQYVQVKGKDSDTIVVGETSVIQGSTLSGLLFLLYILDMPYILHRNIDEPKQYRESQEPNMKSSLTTP